MNVLFPAIIKPMTDFEIGEIGLCNFGGGAELVMLVEKLNEYLGFMMLHDRQNKMFAIHYSEHRSDPCISYGLDWTLVVDPTGDVQMGRYDRAEAGDALMWDGVIGICASRDQGFGQSGINCPLTGTPTKGAVVEAIFKSWKITLNVSDPETGLAPVIVRRTEDSAR